MALALEPIGTLVVHIDQSWRIGNGPAGGRSCSSFREVTWQSHTFDAHSVWGNGSYRESEITEANIRVMFTTVDDAFIFLDYVARVHLPTHTLRAGAPGK